SPQPPPTPSPAPRSPAAPSASPTESLPPPRRASTPTPSPLTYPARTGHTTTTHQFAVSRSSLLLRVLLIELVPPITAHHSDITPIHNIRGRTPRPPEKTPGIKARHHKTARHSTWIGPLWNCQSAKSAPARLERATRHRGRANQPSSGSGGQTTRTGRLQPLGLEPHTRVRGLPRNLLVRSRIHIHLRVHHLHIRARLKPVTRIRRQVAVDLLPFAGTLARTRDRLREQRHHELRHPVTINLLLQLPLLVLDQLRRRRLRDHQAIPAEVHR